VVVKEEENICMAVCAESWSELYVETVTYTRVTNARSHSTRRRILYSHIVKDVIQPGRGQAGTCGTSSR